MDLYMDAEACRNVYCKPKYGCFQVAIKENSHMVDYTHWWYVTGIESGKKCNIECDDFWS